MTDARILLAAGLAGALLTGGVLEWLRGDPAVVAAPPSVLEELPTRRPRPTVDPGLQQCELSRITLEAEVASLEARLAVLQLSADLAKPTHPKDDPIPWPENLSSSQWPRRVANALPLWVNNVPTAHLHEVDCHEMPCLAAVSWEQENSAQVDIGDHIGKHAEQGMGVAAPYGRLVEKATHNSIYSLTVVAVFPADFLTQWPVRIDYRAETLLEALRPGWVKQRPKTAVSGMDADPHGGHAH